MEAFTRDRSPSLYYHIDSRVWVVRSSERDVWLREWRSEQRNGTRRKRRSAFYNNNKTTDLLQKSNKNIVRCLLVIGQIKALLTNVFLRFIFSSTRDIFCAVVALSFSLYGEYVVRFFSLSGWCFFYLFGGGLYFSHQLY